jgi:hypothetical protein
MTRSDWACAAAASPACVAPPTVPGGNPVIAVPGLTPRSPPKVLGPVLVTVCPPSTEYVPALPSPTVAPPALARAETGRTKATKRATLAAAASDPTKRTR